MGNRKWEVGSGKFINDPIRLSPHRTLCYINKKVKKAINLTSSVNKTVPYLTLDVAGDERSHPALSKKNRTVHWGKDPASR